MQRSSRFALVLGFLVAAWLGAARAPGQPAAKDEVLDRADHYRVFIRRMGPGAVLKSWRVRLKGQFDTSPVAATARGPFRVALPVAKRRPGHKGVIHDPGTCLTWYQLKQASPERPPGVVVTNQFGTQEFRLGRPEFLLARGRRKTPVTKVPGLFPRRPRPDHFKCYTVLNGAPVAVAVDLSSPPSPKKGESVKVGRPVLFCVPVDKHVKPAGQGAKIYRVRNKRLHLTVYEITERKTKRIISATDQFGSHTLKVSSSRYLCVPSRKHVRDHYKAYEARVEGKPTAADTWWMVKLKRQAETEFTEAKVRGPVLLANPVAKVGGKHRSVVLEHGAHLTWYALEQKKEQLPPVTVRNQFGTQKLELGQPEFLLAPARKGEIDAGSAKLPDPPAWLNHFKCYRVSKASPLETPEGFVLKDQFDRVRNSGKLVLGKAVYFCFPVEKSRERVYPIRDAGFHLTVYEIPPDKGKGIRVHAQDQFGQRRLKVDRCRYLCVPSTKK